MMSNTFQAARSSIMTRVVSTLLLSVGLLFSGIQTHALAEGSQKKADNNTALHKLLRDEAMEVKIKYNLAKTNPQLGDMRIRPLCFNGVVLLTGEVTSGQLKRQAADVARKTEGVRQVHNQLMIAGSASYLSRMNDNWLEMKVKATIMLEKELSGSQIEVASHRGTTYLIGRVNRQQAKKAVDVASRVGGVQKIVQVFDYQ